MAFGFFDGQKADASPESIKRKRAMIAQLLRGGRAPRDVGEGLHAIGRGLQAAVLGSRADAAEQAGNAEREQVMAPIMGGFGGAPIAAVGGAPVASGAVSGKGYDNPQARETYEYAIAQGLAPHQAAAYTGAKLAESRFNPNARNPGDGRDGTDSIGGFQWNSGRAQALKQFAAQQGKSWNDPSVQRAFSFAELNGSERAAGQALRNAKTPEDATAAMLSYLRPGGWTARNPLGAHSAPARLRNTQGILSAFGNMPVVRPGPGAAPMPLARQQAETAPMPNAGLADMPAPGANQSALEARPVAPVSGDNPQQLLADAAYYEQNGNPEAARQMRERAQTASAGPQGNEGMAQDGAGELQAGGSGLMAEPAVYRGELNNVPAGDLMQRGPMPALPAGFDVSSLITPAGQPSGAQDIADNEEQTRIMEAQMAAEQGLPYAGNEPGTINQSDVYSPIPMGFGRNPFVPYEPDAMAQAPAAPAPGMDRATFEQVTAGLPQRAPAFTGQGVAPSWAGDAEALAPGAQEASGPNNGPFPTPPPRPADLPPQSPLVPPAMRQPMPMPMPMDMGGENSGGGAMQFIESEFARREGRPDPRMAMGAPVAQSPQMGAGGPPMPVGGPSMPMGASPAAQAQGQPQAQAPAQQLGMIPERDLVAVLRSRFTSPEDKRFAMDTLTRQQAMQQAAVERARVDAQNRQTAEALNIDPRLGGVAATNDQKDLAQANKQRREAGLPILRMDEYKIQKARAGATSITNDLSGGSSKQVFDTLKERADAARTAATGLNSLREARKAVSDGGFFGAGADARLGFAKLGQLFGFEDGRITNTETFRSAIAPQVAAVMKATVGSTQISNADREFAEKAAGGSIALDDKSINRLLNIMERASNDIITRHQKQLDAVYPEGSDGKFARERALLGVQAPPAPTQTGPARPSSKAEFDALPSGSTFIAPDGTTRRKP